MLTARLDPDILMEVSDVIRDVSTRTYAHLKAALIKRFTHSEEERLNRLLGDMYLGDRSPSQMLREIKPLAGGDVPDNIVRSLWLKKLPHTSQPMLQALSVSNLTLSQQTDIADKIHTVNTPTVSSVVPTTQSDVLTDLVNQVKRLTLVIKDFSKQNAIFQASDSISHRPRS